MHKGRLIVLEGIDGSGKTTQVKLLVDRLNKVGQKVLTTDFPRYGERSAYFVERYLRGEYGKAKDIGPYVPSIFYALDRFDASQGLEEGLKKGMVIVSNRYMSASLGHQGGKIRNKKERDNYIDWLTHLEFGILKIPKPDLTIYLDIDPRVALRLIAKKGKRTYTKGSKRDIHEADLTHLTQAREAYKYAAKKYGWVVVDCMRGKELKSIEELSQTIFNLVRGFLSAKR